MVLRGSGTAPEHGIYEVSTAMQTARDYLEQTQAEVHELEHEITEVIHEEMDHLRQPSSMITEVSSGSGSIDKQLQLPSDLTTAIRILVDRLDELENKQKEAESLLTTYRDEFRTSMLQLGCGGLAGATARTTVAPIDRVKLLIQTAKLRGDDQEGILPTALKQIRKNGIKSLWKGNLTNCVRVFPYAALQFASYERYKSMVVNWCDRNNRKFGHLERLSSGAMAGATAATLTYPLDVMRVRQAVFNDIKGPMDAMRNIYAEGGSRAFFKGWTPTLMSLAPFIAINFATFDALKQRFLPDGDVKQAHPLLVLGLGASAGLIAQSICYPLDTVRRLMQMPGQSFSGIADCVYKTVKHDGIIGLYRGMLPNAIKIVPNNGIRFLVFSNLTAYLGLPSKDSKR